MPIARQEHAPRKPITVIDRLGRTVVRDNGVALDGDRIRTALMLKDSGAAAGTVYIIDADISAAGARILGETWDAADFAGLSGDAARHAIVRRKLGAVADNRPAQFLDAAWRTLADDDLAAGKAATPATPGPTEADDSALQAARAQLEGYQAARVYILSEAWMSPEARAAKNRDAGLTYEERIGNRWKGNK